MSTQKLAEYVRSHGHGAEVRDGQVWALISWTQRGDGVLTSGADWECLGSTLGAVRDGLGY